MAQASAADPFVLEIEGHAVPGGSDMRCVLVGEREAWEEYSDGEPFQLPVAPDALHKDNVSGGPPYGIVLPDSGAVGRIVAAEEMSFVDYVRRPST